MAKRNIIPRSIADVVQLSESSPSGLRWKKPESNRLKPGTVAGCYLQSKGTYVIRHRGKTYLNHRVMFFLRHNRDPGLLQLDSDGRAAVSKPFR